MIASEIIAGEGQYIVPTYKRPEVVFTHGQGAYLFDSEGNQYLDFTAGIAVNALGHGDPEWVKAISDQAEQLAHVSNLYHTAPHVELARRLVENSFARLKHFRSIAMRFEKLARNFKSMLYIACTVIWLSLK